MRTTYVYNYGFKIDQETSQSTTVSIPIDAKILSFYVDKELLMLRVMTETDPKVSENRKPRTIHIEAHVRKPNNTSISSTSPLRYLGTYHLPPKSSWDNVLGYDVFEEVS